MASDLTEQNENEQENTEQIGDLQQIENLKIQVREMMKHSNPAGWPLHSLTRYSRKSLQNNDLFSIWIRYPAVS
mgnify:CR=1 FL=1